MKKDSFKGILCLPVTPFNKNDEVDEASLRQIIEKLITDSVDALVPTGANSFKPSCEKINGFELNPELSKQVLLI